MSNVQKVVIPKGLVSPNEMVIVEIPRSLQNVPTVVATPKRSGGGGGGGGAGSSGAGQPLSKTLSKTTRTFMSRSYPAGRGQHASTMGHGSYTEGGPVPGHPSVVGHAPGSYREFVPPTASTPPAFIPGQELTRGLHSFGRVDDTPDSIYSPIKKRTIIPQQPANLVMPTGALDVFATSNTTFYEAAPYMAPTSNSSDNSSYQPEPSYSGSPSPPRSPIDLMASMDSLENSEVQRMILRLKNYQSARRQLVLEASSLSTAGDVSRDSMNGSG